MTKQIVKIKKGMTTFVGCEVGEKRLGLLKKVFDADKNYQSLIKQGFLKSALDVKDNRIWLALTEKGKQHVLQFEKRWSQV